jgi:hypothetical protein
MVGSIRSFYRLAEGTTADLGTRGRRNSIALYYKVGLAVYCTASRSVGDRYVEAGFNAGSALA